MTIKIVSSSSAYEQTLLTIVRTLPVERVAQILDFARYIQTQTFEDFNLLDKDETAEEFLADEARWAAQFATTQDNFSQMAANVRADIKSKRDQPMIFTKDGSITPG